MFVVKQLENNSYGELELTHETTFNGFDAAYHFIDELVTGGYPPF